MNLIPKVAEMLGVEIGEKFQIDFRDDKKLFMFSETALLEDGSEIPIYRTLADLVYGVRKIIKQHFEPQKNERYYFVRFFDNGQIGATTTTWTGDFADYSNKFCDNVFRTEAEAEAHKYEIYEKLTGKKWGEQKE